MERIKKTIIGEAEEEARQIESRAREEKEENLRRGRREIEERMQQRLEETGKELERDARRRLMQQRSKHNLQLLEKRNEILRSIFEKAAEHLKELDDDDYREMLNRWAGQLPADAPGEMLCNSEEIDRLEPLVKTINEDRDGGAEVSLTPDDTVESGLVFRSPEFEVDMTIRTKLNELREELTPEVARMVFPDSS